MKMAKHFFDVVIVMKQFHKWTRKIRVKSYQSFRIDGDHHFFL